MAQEFDDLVAAQGIAAARRWYWKQAWLSAPPLLMRRLSTLARPAARARRPGSARMLQNLGNDLRYGWRMCRRAPVVTLSVMLAIAMGIAATTAIFSVMEGVFLRPLPFPRPIASSASARRSRIWAACRKSTPSTRATGARRPGGSMRLRCMTSSRERCVSPTARRRSRRRSCRRAQRS
jgi:hypothetical protein